jgi:hypothetical protein
MHLDLMRDQSREMPTLGNSAEITTLRVWFCKYRTLRDVGVFTRLQTLVVAGIPDADLEFLRGLRKLTYLRIVHLPKVTKVSSVGALQSLETLALETLPGWDASGKVTEIESLAPLTRLGMLKHLSLFGVVPRDRSLKDLERCHRLRSARFSKYPKTEVARFYAATQLSDEHVPEPVFG